MRRQDVCQISQSYLRGHLIPEVGQGRLSWRDRVIMSTEKWRPFPPPKALRTAHTAHRSCVAIFTFILRLGSAFPWESGKYPDQGVGSEVGRNNPDVKHFPRADGSPAQSLQLLLGSPGTQTGVCSSSLSDTYPGDRVYLGEGNGTGLTLAGEFSGTEQIPLLCGVVSKLSYRERRGCC